MWDLSMSQHSDSVSPLSEHPASPALLTNDGPHRHTLFTITAASQKGLSAPDRVTPLGVQILGPSASQLLQRQGEPLILLQESLQACSWVLRVHTAPTTQRQPCSHSSHPLGRGKQQPQTRSEASRTGPASLQRSEEACLGFATPIHSSRIG